MSPPLFIFFFYRGQTRPWPKSKNGQTPVQDKLESSRPRDDSITSGKTIVCKIHFLARALGLKAKRARDDRVSCILVCNIPLLARRTRPKGQARRATIGCLVYNLYTRKTKKNLRKTRKILVSHSHIVYKIPYRRAREGILHTNSHTKIYQRI